jgi:dTMP kinase
LGLFVTLEGIDGAGKSTQARLLGERLCIAGHEVVLTREPGGAPGAEEIRRLLVEGAPGRWSPETEILLFTAARRDHVERVIGPALARGAVVVCDRFVDSTRAYQGDGGLRDAVDRLHEMMIGTDPDLTLILDMEPEAGLGRSDRKAAARTVQGQPIEDRFERRGTAFQAEMRRAFLAIAAAEPGRCRVIDAARPVEAVAEEIWRAVGERLGA